MPNSAPPARDPAIQQRTPPSALDGPGPFAPFGVVRIRTAPTAQGDPELPHFNGAGPDGETGRPPQPTATCDVMVVDDDLAILYTIAEALELEGYSVEIANNGAEALDVLKQVRPRVVLLDLRMPVLDGWAFVDIVRQQGTTFKLVLMTATPDVERWAEEIGADGYLAKPFALSEVLRIMERLVRESDA
jgi:CheY-like chemotaxis protein